MDEPQNPQVDGFDNDDGYESERESDAQGGEISDSASSPDEDMEIWARNIRAEIEANPGSVDEDTVMQYWGDLCLDPAGDQHGTKTEEQKILSPELLDTKISVGELLLRAAPPQHSFRPFLLFHLSDNLGRRFRYGALEDLDDLNRAIKLAEIGVGLFRETPPVVTLDQSIDIIAMGHLNLGTLLLARYESTKNVGDLEKAIRHTKEAFDLVKKGTSHTTTKLTALKNLPLMLVLKCQWTREIDDIDMALKLAREGLALAKEAKCSSDRVAGYLWLLSISSETRYQLNGNIEALSNAIELARQAVAGTSNAPSKKASYLRYLGVMLELRYTAKSDLRDLEEAISCAERGLETGPPPGGPHHLFKLLANLYEAKYHVRGNNQDQEKSLNYRKQAIHSANREDAKDFVGLAELVTSLCPRYISLSAVEDVNESLGILEANVDDSMDMRERTHLISSLAALYETRYNLLGVPGDLDRAISMSEASILCIPRGSPERPKFRGKLASRLQLRYKAKKEIEDLEAAIAWAAEALTEVPITSIHRPSLLHCLSQSLSLLYLESGDPNDLDFALSIGSDAAEEFPEHHPEFAPAMINLGELFYNAFLAEQNEEEKSPWLYWALQFFMNALQCPSAAPRFRLNASGQAAKMHMVLARLFEEQRGELDDPSARIHEHWHNAYEILSETVGRLPVLSSRKLTLDDPQWHLSQHLSLASNAASMAIRSGKPALEAARLLETGRGIIMGNLIEYRQGISGLQRAHPELALEFDMLRQKVEGLYDETIDAGDVGGNIRSRLLMHIQHEQRIRDVKLLESTLQKIRGMPSFETFLLPSESEFQKAAGLGPIVAINVTEASSDAIIIQKTGISCLRLQQLSSTWVKTQIGMIDRNILKSREPAPDKNRRMRALLEMLWVAVVKPVLQELGFFTIHKTGTPLPHIWWIGVGIMARAPFHAAGCYPKSPNSPKADYTSKYCISSYTPTIKSLLYSRAREGENSSKPGSSSSADRLLFITMPTTPGDKALPKAREEAESIISSLPSEITKTLLISPSSRLVLEKIREHNMVHFACHGFTELANPAKSRIILLKGPKVVETLTVKEISAARPFQPLRPNGTYNLAYLSACISADNLSEDLAEEVLHIASGFQLAGFSHVVGTLWMGEHTVSKKIAEEFYKALFEFGGVGRNNKSGVVPISRVTCAEALHKAVDKVKIVEGYWWNPLDWAQFCHWGA